MEFAEQLLRGGDFVGLFRDIDVCQDETGFDVEGVQHLGRLVVGEIVEASSERLAIDRDDTSRRIGNGAAQTSGVLAENLLDRLGIKALEDVSNRGMGRGAPPVQTEAAFNRRPSGGLVAVHRFEEFAAPESATWDCWDDLRNV